MKHLGINTYGNTSAAICLANMVNSNPHLKRKVGRFLTSMYTDFVNITYTRTIRTQKIVILLLRNYYIDQVEKLNFPIQIQSYIKNIISCTYTRQLSILI